MNKKRLIYFVALIIALCFGLYFHFFRTPGSVNSIKREVYSLNQPFTKIVHVEYLNRTKAIAFYEHGAPSERYFGDAEFKKALFNWKMVGGGSEYISREHKPSWGYTNLQMTLSPYTDLLRGKILDPRIDQVFIVAKDNKKYQAKVIKYDHSDEKFWLLVTKGEDLLGATFIGKSKNGEIILKKRL